MKADDSTELDLKIYPNISIIKVTINIQISLVRDSHFPTDSKADKNPIISQL
jgi:hypothetical protein